VAGLPTIRSAIWSGQVRDHSQPCRRSIRSSCRDPGEGPFTDFVSRHPDQKEREAYIKSLQFELILSSGNVYPHTGTFYALDRNLDPRTGSIRYYVIFHESGNIFAAGSVWEGALRRRSEKGRDGCSARGGERIAGQFPSRSGRSKQQGQHSSGENGERIGAMWEVTEGLKLATKLSCRECKSARRIDSHGERVTPPAQQVASGASPRKRIPDCHVGVLR